MANEDYHYVDPKDQRTAAQGVADHSDLTTVYAEPKKEEVGEWLTEDERQKKLAEEREKIQTGLRKSSVLVGLAISIPVVLGILVGQLGMTKVDLNDGVTLVFILVLLGVAVLILTYVLYRWVFHRFQKHSLRALPITLTTLGSLALVTQKMFNFTNEHIGGMIGYGTALGALVVLGVIIATVTIFAWTSKLPGLVKLLVLVFFLGGAAAIFNLT